MAITDANKTAVQRYIYDAFGLPKATTSFKNSYQFTGREWDKETGLYFYRARYYDPLLGRFIQKDPIGFKGGDMVLYGYTSNNPLNHVDPNGLAIWICNRKTTFGVGNHAYLWNDNNSSCCGRGSASHCREKGPKGGDSCRKVEGSDGKEAQIMLCCSDIADAGPWIPPVNDCHTSADDCLKSAGLKNPGAPGGRIGPPCDPCAK